MRLIAVTDSSGQRPPTHKETSPRPICDDMRNAHPGRDLTETADGCSRPGGLRGDKAVPGPDAVDFYLLASGDAYRTRAQLGGSKFTMPPRKFVSMLTSTR